MKKITFVDSDGQEHSLIVEYNGKDIILTKEDDEALGENQPKLIFHTMNVDRYEEFANIKLPDKPNRVEQIISKIRELIYQNDTQVA